MKQLPLPLTPGDDPGAAAEPAAAPLTAYSSLANAAAPPAPPATADPTELPAPERAASSRIDRAEMALRGRIGALRLHATHDPRQTTKRARERFLERFEREVDPDGVLPVEERERRAAYARKAYFARLARESARARRNDPPGHRNHRGTDANGRRAA